MINPIKVSQLIYHLTGVLNPEHVGFSIDNVEFWSKLHENWELYYSSEAARLAMSQLILKELKPRYSKVEPKNFDGFKQDLDKFKQALLSEVHGYRYNTFDKNKFLNSNRIALCTSEFQDWEFATCLRNHNHFQFQKVTKEQMILIIETFCYCFEYIATNLGKRVTDVEQLTLLGLPVEAEELRKVVTECTSLGELFNWNLTDSGYKIWARLYLDEAHLFKERVYNYLNELHPELKLEYEVVKAEKTKYKLESLYQNLDTRTYINRPAATNTAGNAGGYTHWVIQTA